MTIIASDRYTLADEYAYQMHVQPGSEVRFLLYPAEGYVITGTDYEGGRVSEGPNGSTIVVLPSVWYPTRVQVLCEKDENIRTICYDAGEGECLDGASSYLVHAQLNGHLYPNTDIGLDRMKREGYTLVGWNTEADGSGTYIGLGSRVAYPQEEGDTKLGTEVRVAGDLKNDVKGSEALTLYAQWAQWSEAERFLFREEDGGAVIIRYLGAEGSFTNESAPGPEGQETAAGEEAILNVHSSGESISLEAVIPTGKSTPQEVVIPSGESIPQEVVISPGESIAQKADISSGESTPQNVVIPAILEELPVKKIAAGAFYGATIKSLVLPPDIEEVEPEAFCNCTIEEIFFFDRILNFPDSAFFETSIPRVHINAAQPPRFAGAGPLSNYADKVDLLMQNENRKKIVLFGGSGTFYSVLAERMEEKLKETGTFRNMDVLSEDRGREDNPSFDEYIVLNLGINGWFPALPQLDVLRTYMHEGDVLLHIPEMSSAQQLFADTCFAIPWDTDAEAQFDDRFLRSLELNYGLISLMNLQECPGFFDSFSRFNQERQSREATEYSDYSHFINAHGDYQGNKLPYEENVSITQEADIRPELLTEETLTRMNTIYRTFMERGVRVAVAYAAVNEDALKEKGDYVEKARMFDSILRRGILDEAEVEKTRKPDIETGAVDKEVKIADHGPKTAGIPLGPAIIENIEDSFYPGGVFYNSDWHLSYEADWKNTDVITKGLAAFLQ
ncbi:MAG: leucine-rich repeat protein [Lachnospiraceae bacterium]|nr:leucine-rich repeat protein [Lachnospiraceae bacterium]